MRNSEQVAVYVVQRVTGYVSNLNILLKGNFPTFFDISIIKEMQIIVQ